MSESQEQPTPTRPEISSSPTAEAGKPNVDKSLQKSKKGTIKGKIARALLSATALASAIESTMFIPRDTMPREEVLLTYPAIRELSQHDLEQRVETLYQIQIVSPKELPEIEVYGKKVKTLEWTKQELAELMWSLDKLPPHFYFPAPKVVPNRGLEPSPTKPENFTTKEWEAREQRLYEQIRESLKKELGEDFVMSREDFEKARLQGYIYFNPKELSPVEFILVDKLETLSERRSIGLCDCFDNNINQQVILSKTIFEGRLPQERLSKVTHELVHRITKPTDQTLVVDMLELPEGVSINKFFETNLKDVDFYTRHNIKYGSGAPLELIAVMGEFYIQGKERFLKVYEHFIGEQKAGKFYDYMRDNIFRGTEYKNYQKIVK